MMYIQQQLWIKMNTEKMSETQKASKQRAEGLKSYKWIIKILYIRYLNICTVHKKNQQTEFIITNVSGGTTSN